MLVRQKQNLEQDLIVIKVHTGPIEKTVKYHSSVFINIMGNTIIMGLVIKVHINEQCEIYEQLKERETCSQHRLKIF